MSEIKASEILLDLDNRLKTLERQLKLQEFQLRIIIDNFNRLLKTNPSKEPQTPVVKITEVKASSDVKAIKSPPVAKTEDEDYVFKSEIATEKKAEVKLGRPKAAEKKITIPVTQVLKYSNGDPAVAANIIIKNEKGLLVKVTNTNTVGRWQSFLEEGNYTVFAKATSPSDESIEFCQNFEVINTKTPINLPQPS